MGNWRTDDGPLRASADRRARECNGRFKRGLRGELPLEDGTWIAYAQWPTKRAWERARELDSPLPSAFAAMRVTALPWGTRGARIVEAPWAGRWHWLDSMGTGQPEKCRAGQTRREHMQRRVAVVPHEAGWAREFSREASTVRECLGANTHEVHHIGSTAIRGIFAKPVIDILAEVVDIEAVAGATDAMCRAGYEAMGEFGIPGRRFFRKDDSCGQRTHHVHTFETGHPDVARHLAFRDYLCAHPEVAQEYSDLKRGLAAAHADDIEWYMDGKDAFIKDVDRVAASWWLSREGR